MSWQEKVKRAMSNMTPKLTQEKLAEELSVTQGALSHWLNGRREADLETIEKIGKLVGLTLAELLTSDNNTKNQNDFPRPVSKEDFAIIPFYSAKASCGAGYSNEHVEIKKGLAFGKDWLISRGLYGKRLCVLKADGESMWPTFSADATLLINQDYDRVISGKVYLFTHNGEERIKRFFHEFSGDWRIASDNPNKALFPDSIITSERLESLNIIGRVVWFDGEL